MTPQQLRNSILQQAIEGKLVEQRPEEGSAEELYAQIQKEKKKLIAEGKIKKEKPLPEITEDEIPFDIPESWKWVRIGDIFTSSSGTTPSKANPDYYNKYDFNWVRTTDLNNGILTSCEIKISEIAKKECKLEILPRNSVCIAMYGGAGTIGKNALIDFDTTINQSVFAIHQNHLCNMRYIQYFIQSYRDKWMDFAAGSRRDPNINGLIIKRTVFPLPPLAEQKRIVAKIKELQPFVDKYEKAYNEFEEYNARFPEDMRKSILQMAIEGKLVEQRPEEGTAEELYAQIQNEKKNLISEGKIKKEKPLPEITDEEIPFDIPESWEWVRLKQVVDVQNGDRGKNYPSKDTLHNEGIPFISAINLDGKTVISDNRLMCLDDMQFTNLRAGKLQLNDLVVCIRGSLGKHGIYPFEKGAIASSLVILRQYSSKSDLTDYLSYYLDSSLFFKEIKKYDNGTAQPNLAAKDLEKFLIPLPPLAEQKRIVAKIEELLPYCDKLK
ncbi:MAG: restriction endonuclease subunit S [Succinivibrio dextrinosolvens]|nr:restriction endonuclease subunit S [Succinivibrio dextrinosolvens]